MKIRKNDKIKVISGKDRGKEGKVLKIFPEVNKVLVEGVNKVKKHIKPKGKESGGVIEVERPVRISNVMLVCPKCKKPTRVGFKFEDRKKFRKCKKCEKQIS